MAGPVLLLTDRSTFAEAWTQAFAETDVDARSARPDELTLVVEGASAVVVDAASAGFDEDELLAAVGLVRGLGATAAVELPEGQSFPGIADVLDDLCPGLVARGASDVARVASAVARRGDTGRARTFEYVTVSPRPGELLAILADGTAVLVRRPVAPNDDGSEVSSIALGDDAEAATLSLASGEEVTLVAAKVAFASTSAGHIDAGSNGRGATIDGARLGARLRELRVAAGLTQAELARRTGIHRPNIARVEAGRHTPSLDTLARLASAIGVPTTRVLAEE